MDTIELVNWINKLIQYHNIKAFYNSALWEHKRAEVLERDNNECQKCKSRGLYSEANCAHHKEHLRKHPELALELDNLISLCNSCHDEEHPEKLKHDPKPQLNEERW